MRIGIRPTNDLAFKKIFGSTENARALISLLNAILVLKSPIIDVTIENPYNLQDFESDKLSILDVKAIDQSGAIYDVEMQLTVFSGLVQRIVFYGCELYAGQLKAGENYDELRPAYSICLIDGILWRDATAVHHRFQLVDQPSGRVLHDTLEIHTLELGRYTLTEGDLPTSSTLEWWLFWLLHAHEYESEELLRLFPQAAFHWSGCESLLQDFRRRRLGKFVKVRVGMDDTYSPNHSGPLGMPHGEPSGLSPRATNI